MKRIYSGIILLGVIIVLIGCEFNEQPVEKIEFPTHEFTVSSLKDTTLFGEQGTRIFIGSNTFQYLDGKPVTDSITIQLKEFYDKADIILGELSTESNDKLLETGGMLNLKAFAQDKEVEIQSGKKIVVHFPKRNGNKKMSLFYADESATDTSVNNWDIDTTDLVKRTLKLGSFGWWHPSIDDSTGFNFTPKNFVDTGYYWNPIDFYVKSYNFSGQMIKEIERTKNINNYPKFDNWNNYGVECEMYIFNVH